MLEKMLKILFEIVTRQIIMLKKPKLYYIDEVDKIRKIQVSSITRDVSGEVFSKFY